MEINCGKAREADIGKAVTVNGWCRYIRDHGGKLFIDLADRYGTTQLVFEGEIKGAAESIGREYVISVSGKVRGRSSDNIDSENPTGKVEILVSSFNVISTSKVPVFEITEEKEKFLPSDELRMEYRYLDLRRRKMIENVEFRDAVTKCIRKFFWENGFLELETPILVRDTFDASGSRTFISPSRSNKGKFYGLPQSPQIYKQIAMIGGLDRYFQIAKVFRDEDPREDRQPEFTQVDLEVSFKDEAYIQGLIEGMLKSVFKQVLGLDLATPFQKIDYSKAMELYGSDKPDTRFKNFLIDTTMEFEDTDYNVIKRVIAAGGKVKAIRFPAEMGKKSQKLSKKQILELVEVAKNFGLKGLTWVYVSNGKIESDPPTITASLKKAEKKLISKLDAKDGDLILVGSDTSENLLLSAMSKVGRIVGLLLGMAGSRYAFLWVERFPLFERDEISGSLQPMHNPFVAPTQDTVKLLDTHPEKVIGRRYDLVLNGIEIGGGSIRIHEPELQKKVLSKMGLSEEQIESSLGFLLRALSFGAPIHGGIALGLDRLVAVLKGNYDIRDFILFPKNKKFQSPLDGSPSGIDTKRLEQDYGLTMDDKK
ncbi:aspartate--tRNA ligase [Candidatus Parvarchaeota archaeon]|nr:aspartate--tRNA ligase [Candidatus Parvarchaeota archaeon]